MHDGVDSSLAKRIAEGGSYAGSRTLNVRYIASDGFRFSVVVSKKQGKAVARNRVKRVVRELIRERRSGFPDGSYLVYYRGMCDELSRVRLRGDIDTVIETMRRKSGKGAEKTRQ